jgi:hypothetical protein
VSRRFALRLAVSLALALAFAWALRREGLAIVPPRAAFRGLRAWAVPVYLVLLAGVHFLRAARWRLLLAPIGEVPLGRVLAVAWVGFCAIMLLPLRLGEVVRPVLVAEGQVSRTAAFGTIAVERVLDGVFVSVVLFVCLFAIPDAPGWIRATAVATLGLFVAALAVLYAIRSGRGRVEGWLGARLGGLVRGVADGLAALPDRRILGRFLAETALYWALNGVSMWALARGTGIGLSMLGAFTAMSVLAVGILLPAGPGLFGAFQYSLFLALGLFLAPAVVRGPGAAFVFLLWVIQLGLHLAVAAVATWGGHLEVRRALGS